MKKLFLILFMIPAIGFSQDAGTKKLWKKGGVFSSNFSQVSLSNWAAGGKSSASGVLLINTFANYKKDSLSWDNSLSLNYGFLKEKEGDLVKSSDLIDFSSMLGYATGKFWNYSALLNFRTQFAPGYNYPRVDNDNPISKFLAPGYLNLALGMNYKRKDFSLFISPATGKFTFVHDDYLSSLGSFGVDVGKKFRSEFGSLLKMAAQTELVKNVTVQTKLGLFSNYFHNPQNIDVDWSTMISMKINDFLSTNLITQLLYDDDIKILDPDTGHSAPKVQFMEMFGVGLTMKF
ncbi:MAG: hypothetical protein CSA36_02045 [Draconibacterium sp.]|nr:MAG: hypothetical protein CSA36_02045 [Draconibacterium sp.]